MQSLFTWIHLSDLHVGHGSTEHQWDQALMMDALRRDALAMRARGLCPDAILVTGDIAFSGGGRLRSLKQENREYAEAQRWLERLAKELAIPTSSVFCVPGNHDVDRSVDNEPEVAELLGRLRAGQVSLDEVMAQESQRQLLSRRQRNYWSFACALSNTAEEEKSLYWQRRFPLRGCIHLRIVGLNTALLAAADDDHGKLALGMEQLAVTLNDIRENEFVLAMMHHPLSGGWLRDERVAAMWTYGRAQINLAGHIHEADNGSLRSGAGVGHVRISAGAAHNEAAPAGVQTEHGYSWGQMSITNEGLFRLRIWPRVWNARSLGFVVDGRNVLAGVDYTEHPLMLGPGQAEELHNSYWVLFGEDGPLKGHELPLRPGVNIIGRDPSVANIQILTGDSPVSRIHASVLVHPVRMFIQDESRNGTWVNGERLPHRQPVELKLGASIQVGRSSFRLAKRYVSPTDHDQPPTPIISTVELLGKS